MDIIIPLASNSYNDNLELRYALRSIQKHLQGYNNIFLIGRKPAWAKNVQHIPMNEYIGDRFRDMNMRKKVMMACVNHDVSDQFLYFHDDHFLLKNVHIKKFPAHYKGTLDATMKLCTMRHQYRIVLMNTIKLLVGKNKMLFDFDTHAPMAIDKQLFINATKDIDYNKAFAIKSLYANLNDLAGEFYPDLKIKNQISKAEISILLHGRPYFSTSDRALGPDMIDVFNTLYSKPSKYELL